MAEPLNLGDPAVQKRLAAQWGYVPAQGEPVALTPREVELIDGMIDAQLHHAKQCDSIANRTMADKQKGWDIERVELLRKLRAAPKAAPAPVAPPETAHDDQPRLRAKKG